MMVLILHKTLIVSETIGNYRKSNSKNKTESELCSSYPKTLECQYSLDSNF